MCIKIIGELTIEEQKNIASAVAGVIDKKVTTIYNDFSELVLIVIEDDFYKNYQEHDLRYTPPACIITNHTTTYDKKSVLLIKRLKQFIKGGNNEQ